MPQPNHDKEIVLCHLERERENWLPLHARAVRAGGWSAEANLDAAEAFAPIDRLLDELGSLALSAATTDPQPSSLK